jgi:hypothetical protein
MMFSKITLIDHDYRRKANISMEMSEVGIFCDPYADVSEFIESGSSKLSKSCRKMGAKT